MPNRAGARNRNSRSRTVVTCSIAVIGKKLGKNADGPFVGATNGNGRVDYRLGEADNNTFTTDSLADRTVEFIRANRDKPFCYMLNIPDPHGPNLVRAPYDTNVYEFKISAAEDRAVAR